MDQQEIIDIIRGLHLHSEDEVVELKEAKANFDTRDIGRYFSALSNEANLRGLPYSLLIFGVANDGEVCGTAYRKEAAEKSIGLQRLKKEIADQTNNRITFKDIYELDLDGKRVIAFVIPPATRGIPTQWAGAAYAREGESLVPLPLSKIDEIRSEPPRDWSREVVAEASIADLDPDAVAAARRKMQEKLGDRENLIAQMDDAELLDKAAITWRGQITNAALLLLGTKEAAKDIVGALPKITWSLYEKEGTVRTYEHFDPPFLLTIDDVLAKVRNEKIRILANPESLVPVTVSEYDDWSLRELIGNAIAHQDYTRGGKVNIAETPDGLIFLNEGSFIPESLERSLSPGYKPPYYRNPFLASAMLEVKMLDQNAMGIRTICEEARSRFMPLPTYDLSDPNRVKVNLVNHEISAAYTHILFLNPDLPILTVLALDKVQKGMALSAQEAEDLRNRGLAEEGPEGWELIDPKPHPIPLDEELERHSAGAGLTVRSKAGRLVAKTLMQSILESDGPLSTIDLTDEVRKRALAMNAQWLADIGPSEVYRLLKAMEDEGRIKGEGKTRAKTWAVVG